MCGSAPRLRSISTVGPSLHYMFCDDASHGVRRGITAETESGAIAEWNHAIGIMAMFDDGIETWAAARTDVPGIAD